MKILVTGGSGFIASHIVDEYIRLGHRVWVVDNLATGRKVNLNPKAKFKKIDVRNRPALKKLFHSVRFDVVNHHAAQADVRLSVADPKFDADVNIMGLLNLLTLAVETKVKKVIFASSGGTLYGECKRAGRETDPEEPLSPYGVAKLTSEKYIKSFAALHNLKYTIFRYSNVYGPRQDPHGEAGVVAIFCGNFLKGKKSFVFGNGKQTRDFVYVKDVARANGMALRKGHNDFFNVGVNRETSVIELYNTMARIMRFPHKPLFKPARKGELDRSFLSYAKIQKKMGWKPRTSLKQGLAETIEFFRERPLGPRR